MIWATRGAVVIGVILLIWHGIEWYPGFKALKKKPLPYLGDWLPFILGWAYGALAVLTVMGLIGWVADGALWCLNWLGDAAAWALVGENPRQASHGVYQPLTSDGNWMVLILSAVVVAVIKFRPSGAAVYRGLICGLCLGTSAGVAGLAAAPLAAGVSTIGAAVFGAVT